MKHSLLVLSLAATSLLALGGCAAVDAGGRVVSGVGNWLSTSDNSVVQTGGKFYQDIGGAISSAANTDPNAKKKQPEAKQ